LQGVTEEVKKFGEDMTKYCHARVEADLQTSEEVKKVKTRASSVTIFPCKEVKTFLGVSSLLQFFTSSVSKIYIYKKIYQAYIIKT